MHLLLGRELQIALLLAINPLIRHATAQSQSAETTTATVNTNTLGATSSQSLTSATSIKSSQSSRTLATSTFSDIIPTYTNSFQATPSSNTNNTDDDGKVWASDKTTYYYIFIAIFIVVGLFVLWIIRRRRRLRQLRRRDGRQNALLQDAAGWPNNRRWIHGNRTVADEAGGDVTGSGWDTDRNEGLDERGEAPPPYKPANQPTVQPVDETAGEGSSARGSGEIAVPARVADRTKPPDYEERRTQHE